MNKENKQFFFETLRQRYPEADTELHYSTPFQLLMSVILSAQTTDKQVNKITAPLYTTLLWPQDILDMWYDVLRKAINSVNYNNSKAKNIYRTAEILTDKTFIDQQKELTTHHKAHERFQQYGYYIPDSVEQLTRLWWVGEKTAKVVCHVLYDHPVVAVDTHVHRVSNRIWLVKTKEPLDTSKIIEKKIGKEFLDDAHHGLILFGRYHCTAQRPQCDSCPFTHFCTYYKTIKTTKRNNALTWKITSK